MKGIRYILFILALLTSVGMRGQYNPTNPAEPGSYYTLTLQATPSNGGSFNLSTVTSYSEGTNVSLRAYTNTNFTFSAWELDGEVISTSSTFNYTMPAKNVKLIAHYKYNPSNPSEPTEPQLPVYSTLSFSCSPASAGSFNISSGNRYEVGTSVNLRAYNNSNFIFKNWTEDGEVISTSSSFNYVVKAGNPKLVANFTYSPSSPGEPLEARPYYKLYLKSNPSGGGYFNVDSGNGYQEGESVYLRAYNNQWYTFTNWTDENGEVVSTSSSFYYNMPGSHKTLTANYTYNYNPTNPNEPVEPSNKDANIYGMTENSVRGQTITYPVYLANPVEMKEMKVDIQFPKGFACNTEDVRLAGRATGHDVEVTSLGDNNYRVYVTGSEPFEGRNGKVFDMLVSIPDTARMGNNYPVLLTHGVIIGLDNSQTPVAVRSGHIYVEKISEDGLYAKFSIDKLQGRVKFTNLSSGKAVSYVWDFGDGTTSTEKDPLHIYDKSGYYNVKLTAKGEVDEDVAEMAVLINDESTWKVDGTFYLSDVVSGVRYFTDAESLFRFITATTIGGDVKVSVKADGSFVYPLTNANLSILQSIQSSLANGGNKLSFAKHGTGRNPVFSFGENGGTINRSTVDTMIELGRYLECNGVELRMWGVSFDPSQVSKLQSQRIHSGDKTSEVDFSRISSDLVFTWTLSEVPEGISGYQKQGSGKIPSMTIINEGVGNGTLIYNVKGTRAGVTFCEFTNEITVTPALVGLFTALSPADGTVSESTTITLTWNSITNAVYDVYLWNANNQRPQTPVISGTTNLQYQSKGFCQNGNTYKWQVVARAEGQSLASDTLSFAVRSLPDLHVYALDCSEPTAGQKFTVQWTVKNDGLGSTGSTEWNDYIWFVTDVYAGTINGTSTNNAKLLATVKNVKSLESGESYHNSVDLILDKRTYGNGYIIVAADMYSVTGIEWSAIGGSVLNPYNPSQDGSTYKHLYAQTTASYNNVYEQGETPTYSDNFSYKKIEIAVSLLPDLQVPSISAQVIPVGSIHSTSLDETFEAMVPSPVTAAGLSHNTAWYSGKKVKVTATIANKGGAATEKVSWRNVLYMSHFQNREEGELIAVASENTPSMELQPDGTVNVEFTLNLPYEWYGDTYFHVYTDINDAVYELANTVNNWGVSDKIDILLCPGADFVPSDLTCPSSITSATPFNVSYKVTNKGAGVPYYPRWTDKVYISKNDKGIDNTAILLSTINQVGSYLGPSNIAPTGGMVFIPAEDFHFQGDNYSKTIEVSPSKLTDGTYYMYVQVDAENAVYEHDGENNNVIRSSSITVKHVVPDLTAELLSISEDTLATGREIAFTWKLKNTGTGDIKDAKITDTFFATVNMDGTGGTQFATVENTVWIAAGSEKTLRANIKIPSNTNLNGLRYIYMKTNVTNTVAEVNTTNNQSNALKSWCKYVAEPTQPTTKGTNLSVNNLSVPSAIKPNTQVTLSYVVRNNGDTDLKDQTIAQEIFLCPDYTFSEANSVKCDIVKQTGSVKGLKAGSAVTISQTFTVPSTMIGGNKYLFVFVDCSNSLNEKKVDDNYGRANVNINGCKPNLTVTNYALADTLMTSQKSSLKFTMSNEGDWNANKTTSRIYLSSNSTYDSQDVELATVAIPALSKGRKTDCAVDVSVADKYTGKWFILIQTDAYGTQRELGTLNQVTAIPVTLLQSPLPDLAVAQLSTEEVLTCGQPMKVTYEVKNAGAHATRSSKWSDTFYLSPSTVLNTKTATQLGSKAHVGTLEKNGSYTNEVSFNIPTTLQGNYMFFVVTDASDAITESDENNNAICIPVYVNSSADTPSDLVISGINAPANMKAGEEITISYKLSNEGEFTAAGNVHDVIYLSKDNKWDLNDEMVGTVSGNLTIEPGNTVTRTVKGRITNVPEGNYYVIVKTNATKTIAEKKDDNNTAVMNTSSRLSFNTITLGGSASVKTSGYYKLEVPNGYSGKTVGLYLNHPDDATAGLYASFEQVPSTAKYEYSASKLLENQQEVLIPNAQAGNYYILAQDNAALVNGTGNVFSETSSGTNVTTQMTLDAKEVHFGATTLSIAEGGNGGWVSTDINGALFDSIMDFRLKMDREVIPAESVTYNGMTKTRVTFNLNKAETGSYDVVSELPDGTQATLPNGFRVIPGTNVNLGIKLDVPSVVRVGNYAPFSISYANGGNTDIEIYGLVIALDNGYLATTIQGLDKHQSSINLDLDTEGDNRGYMSIPPGTQKTINLFMYQTVATSHMNVYIVK